MRNARQAGHLDGCVSINVWLRERSPRNVPSSCLRNRGINVPYSVANAKIDDVAPETETTVAGQHKTRSFALPSSGCQSRLIVDTLSLVRTPNAKKTLDSKNSREPCKVSWRACVDKFGIGQK